MKVGIVVYCAVCDHRKKPRGRSAPMGLRMCDYECKGYDQAPLVGDLWPGETEEEFGYPCGSEGTRERPESVRDVAKRLGFKPLTREQEDDNFDKGTRF